MIAIVLLTLFVEAILIAKCIQWHGRFRQGNALLKKFRQQIGSKYPDDRSWMLRIFQRFWDKTCYLGFVFCPLLLILFHVSQGCPVSFATYLLLSVWAFMPVGELCAIINRCEILELRILNSELELLRRSYNG